MDQLRKSDWVVIPVSLKTARRLVETYHYARSATNTRVYTHGLFRKGEESSEDNCKGIAWWLPPTMLAAQASYPGDWRKVLSLTRMVIVPDVPKNAASFLLSRSVKLIDNEKWHCLVTYADTWQNHTGTIYKASNWEYMGLTRATPVYRSPEGKMMGKKRGLTSYSEQEMADMGFENLGKFRKHKFRLLING